MAAAISSHNKKQLETHTPNRPSTCRVKDKCPLDGKCQATEVVYWASISDGTTMKFYTGLLEPPFKSRYANHQTSLRHEKYRHSTELSKHVWALKDKNMDMIIKWEILDHQNHTATQQNVATFPSRTSRRNWGSSQLTKTNLSTKEAKLWTNAGTKTSTHSHFIGMTWADGSEYTCDLYYDLFYKPSHGEVRKYRALYQCAEWIYIIILSVNIESTRIQTHIIYDRRPVILCCLLPDDCITSCMHETQSSK